MDTQKMTTAYKPLGRRILLHVIEKEKRAIHIPDNAQNPSASRFQVVAIGPEVDREKYPVNEGDILQLVQQPTSMAGVDPDQMLLSVMDYDLNVIVSLPLEVLN